MEQSKEISCAVRMSKVLKNALKVAAAKNETTIQDILYSAVVKYLKEDIPCRKSRHTEVPPNVFP